VSKLRSYGLRVSHVALQSILSKVKPDMLEERIQLAIKNIIEIKKRFPDIKAGFICALPTKGREYKEPYRRVADGVKKAGYTLDFIHLDCPYNAPQSGKRIDWKKVKEVEKYVKREIGAEFGFISTSAIGKKSEEAFYTHVMDIFNRYIKGETLPDAFILMSWYPYPSRALPEDAPEGEYPMTKVGLHFAKHLKEWAQSE